MEKIIVSDNRKFVTVDLESQEGGQVEIYTSFNVGQQRYMTDFKSDSGFEKGLNALKAAIKDWNLYESADKKMEVTIENMQKAFNSDDFMKLVAAMTGMEWQEFQDSIEDGSLQDKVKKNLTRKSPRLQGISSDEKTDKK